MIVVYLNLQFFLIVIQGFILTQDLTKKNITSNYGVDHFLDVFINHLTYRYTFGYKINYPWISKSQIIQR